MKFSSFIRQRISLTSSIFFAVIILILLSICNVSFSQGRRDRDINIRPNESDTLKVPVYIQEPISIIEDTLRTEPVDSTARIKYFTYTPEYSYGTELLARKHPLLLDDSQHLTYDVSFDSTGYVIIRQKFAGEEIRAPLILPIEEYLKELSVYNARKGFRDITSERFITQQGDELSQLFQKFTDITIPLPFETETIFGPPTFNLRLNGAIDITASYSQSETEQFTTQLDNKQNSINFKQEVQVTAKGKVGDKLSIDADWNTQRIFDFENQLKLKYEGYADEVIQKIEAGNVNLETRVGLISSSQALFGVKGEFKLGPLTLTSVVSQKQSKTESKDYSGGAAETEFSIEAWNYSEKHYFLELLYKDIFEPFFNDSISAPDNYQILDGSFEIWVSTTINDNANKKLAALHINLPPKPTNGYDSTLRYPVEPEIPGKVKAGYFRKLNPSEYTLNQYAGFVSLKINVDQRDYIGVAYTRNNGSPQNTVDIGDVTTGLQTDSILVLKMIKSGNVEPAQDTAWSLMMKNIYDLPVSNIVEDGFDFNIYYRRDDGNEDKYFPNTGGVSISESILKVMGLDRYQGRGRSNPGTDNVFDFIPGFTIDQNTGSIIFPTLEPFKDRIDLLPIPADSVFSFPDIYTKIKNEVKLQLMASRYKLKGRARGVAGISNVISLGFNVVEGSVKVKLGQGYLTPSIDYIVDYSTGTVTIINAAARLSKDLKVEYETNDLFTLASKTFIGARGDYKISDNSSLGFTFVNLNQKTLNDKVRVGEEPINNMMFGIDFTTEFKPKFLTNLVNMLPGYNTKEESSITFKGELALINPDPNTKKSIIPIDNNEAVAYIDDMEGVKKVISLGTTFSSWTISSLPLDNHIGKNEPEKQAHRGMMYWYNDPSNKVPITDIYPLKDITGASPDANTVTPLDMVFTPFRRGTYNYNSNIGLIPDKKVIWNGMMRFLNTTTNDLISENINFIEFNMRIGNLNSDNSIGNMFIEIGLISEDAIPNGKLDTEDKNSNGVLDPQYDIGLDFVDNNAERDSFRVYNGLDPTGDDYNDPALDDVNLADIKTWYRTQNNRDLENGRRPDTEILNPYGSNINLVNEYFQYKIDLDTNDNRFIVGSGKDGWHQYKIPLSEFLSKTNGANFRNIQYVRVWFTGVNDSINLSLYELSLTGNQWIKPNNLDTSYNVTVVSLEENPQTYTQPVAGFDIRQTIRNQNNIDSKGNEQSLSIEVKNLTNGERKFARKDFQLTALDLFNYKNMKLFVNGDPSFTYINESVYDATMIVRFGNDSNNYYEYRAPVHPDIRPSHSGWSELNYVDINFSDLTQIKVSRDTVTQLIEIPVPDGPPGSVYRVIGNPNLQSIKEILLGVEKNRGGLNSTISGSVWFNEVRLVNVEDKKGYAFDVSANVKFADLLDINFGIRKDDPFFHDLDRSFGSRRTGLNWNISGTLHLHKILNNVFASLFSEEWKDFLTLPITFRHVESMDKPRYYPGTDILLDDAAEQKYLKALQETGSEEYAQHVKENTKIEAQTLTVNNYITINNMSFKFPSNNFIVNNIINKLGFNFDAKFGNKRNITDEYRNEFEYNGRVNFAPEFGLSDNLHLNLGKLLPLGEKYENAKLYFFLPFIPIAPLFSNNFVASTDFNRSRDESKNRDFVDPNITRRDFRANRGFRFNWKFIENWIVDLTGDYDLKVGSDLTPFETYGDSIGTQRPDSEILNNIFFNKGVVNFGKDLDYHQTMSFNPKFNFPFIDKFFTITGNYVTRYGWTARNQLQNQGSNIIASNTIATNVNFKIKEIFKLFDSGESKLKGVGTTGTQEVQDDKQSIGDILKLFTTFIPDNININFTQKNDVWNAGVAGLPGFGNFWVLPSYREDFGPSRLYQLGLSHYPGKRAPSNYTLNLSDRFDHRNEVSLNTTINPIFPQNITMNISFKKAWGFNNNYTYVTNPFGEVSNSAGLVGIPNSKTTTRANGHSMFFAGDIEKLEFLPQIHADAKKEISELFRNEIASFPFPNWTLSITGLEKFEMFEQFATSVSLDNSFISDYKENFNTDVYGVETAVIQSVSQSFSPLIGLNINFKNVMGGNLTSTFRINKSVTNTLNPSNFQIQTTKTNEWSINTNFSKTGFNIPFFGLDLQNDISFALTISKSVNRPIDTRFEQFGNKAITELNGSEVLTFNPSIQYSLSQKVSMQLFFKHISTKPTTDITNLFPRKSNEGGLNFRIAIQ